jgi:hypothetical protein
MLENTKGAIKNGQSRETGNIVQDEEEEEEEEGKKNVIHLAFLT